MLALGRENKLITRIQFPHSGPNVVNIQYVDDTFIFLAPTEDCMVNLKRILCCFYTCSGLKINLINHLSQGLAFRKTCSIGSVVFWVVMLCPFQSNTWDCLCITRWHPLTIGHQYWTNLRPS